MSKEFRTNTIMHTFGTDFSFSAANEMFDAMD